MNYETLHIANVTCMLYEENILFLFYTYVINLAFLIIPLDHSMGGGFKLCSYKV